MKKFILSIMVIFTLTIVSSFSNIKFENPGGWTASCGGTFLPGVLESWHPIPGGYGLICTDFFDICFEIDGPTLILYTDRLEGILSPNVNIFRTTQ